MFPPSLQYLGKPSYTILPHTVLLIENFPIFQSILISIPKFIEFLFLLYTLSHICYAFYFIVVLIATTTEVFFYYVKLAT